MAGMTSRTNSGVDWFGHDLTLQATSRGRGQGPPTWDPVYHYVRGVPRKECLKGRTDRSQNPLGQKPRGGQPRRGKLCSSVV
jgi:hypothetical protein